MVEEGGADETRAITTYTHLCEWLDNPDPDNAKRATMVKEKVLQITEVSFLIVWYLDDEAR